jgi:predicted nucleic acid-binding protein
VAEPGTDEVAKLITNAEIIGTSIISRAETVAAFAKATRMGVVTREEAKVAVREFRFEWSHLVRIQATELLISRADALAWDLGLRGYDAVHLASAMLMSESIKGEFLLATYDRQLWNAAGEQGLNSFPRNSP